ncbi:hypothetical protein Daura_15210 [Dactylosporangium aurantiacum]|uniref:DUF305 domain-containing protein n=1 Tax=Dactylosporangium aurantiacum TaxID=35754 RepID=A0A9Q9IKM9_9ACTN|nr:hypothetical protein [Dactylosporangium aurantiacum]MDG6108421.1 hypothetical protein [Dactylosporangium aurantiacum]UWZ57381.1 hypothetical protein Daura_15210 [Dactylosporangium aurantiacum]
MSDDKPAATAETPIETRESAETSKVTEMPETTETVETTETSEATGTTEATGTPETAAAATEPAPGQTQPPAKPRRNVKQRSEDPPSTAEATVTDGDDDEEEERGRDVWRRVGAVAIVLVAAFAVVVLWARPAHEPAPPAATGAQGTSAPPAVTVLNPTDIAYLQLMISLDTSAAQLFDHIIASGDPVLGPIARTGAEGHRTELAALRRALSDGGAVEDSSIHAGHDLPGMVVDADMAAIRALPPAQQPAKALEVLRDHLTGTTALCGSEAKNGADPATKAAAQQVLDAHSALLAQLPAM